MRVLGIAGSLRRDSHNARLLRAAAEAVAGDVELTIFDGLKDVPPYDQDDDVEPAPEAVAHLRAAIAEADAILIATPEYNHSIPGQLKNALDWASRPYPGSALSDKPAAVIGSSVGSFGAIWAQAELRKVLGATGARVLPGRPGGGQVGRALRRRRRADRRAAARATEGDGPRAGRRGDAGGGRSRVAPQGGGAGRPRPLRSVPHPGPAARRRVRGRHRLLGADVHLVPTLGGRLVGRHAGLAVGADGLARGLLALALRVAFAVHLVLLVGIVGRLSTYPAGARVTPSRAARRVGWTARTLPPVARIRRTRAVTFGPPRPTV